MIIRKVMTMNKEELRRAFWHGVNTTIPERVISKGPIACAEYIDEQFQFLVLGESAKKKDS